jgi:micrococcal nuclease
MSVKSIFAVLAVILMVTLPLACRSADAVSVASVIDGDTIRISGNICVRYLGIDTPEIGEPYYHEARDCNAGLLRWKNVTLQADITDKDVYDRLLRYVYAGDLLVNAELVRQGYAFVYTRNRFPDNRYYDVLKSALDDAVRLRKGIWSLKNHPKLANKNDYYLPSLFSN